MNVLRLLNLIVSYCMIVYCISVSFIFVYFSILFSSAQHSQRYLALNKNYIISSNIELYNNYIISSNMK